MNKSLRFNRFFKKYDRIHFQKLEKLKINFKNKDLLIRSLIISFDNKMNNEKINF